MLTETVYLEHNNRIDIILKADGITIDLSDVTGMKLVFPPYESSGDGTVISSTNLDNDPILWAKGGYEAGEVRLFLGGESIPIGRYKARLVVYDVDNVDGIVWGKIPIKVEAKVAD